MIEEEGRARVESPGLPRRVLTIVCTLALVSIAVTASGRRTATLGGSASHSIFDR